VATHQQFCPAKINLFLAVTGRRDDGFHRLVSLVLPLDWGDDLEVSAIGPGREHQIECNWPGVPDGPENLIWKAADAHARRTGRKTAYRFRLTKRVPMGSGLGGGSSDAVGALKAINRLAREPLDPAAMSEVAAEVGSDCPLFLRSGPVVIRGRGEIVETIPESAQEKIMVWRVALFKPAFSVGTAWAYDALASRAPASYLDPDEADSRLGRLLADPDCLPAEGTNSFELPVGFKFPAIPLLLDRLRTGRSWWAQMSGSGSACFAVVRTETELEQVREAVGECWGNRAFLAEARPV
jgi:4-diphosphocytidyl-2-C-methyl-D-erythritol kinase